MVACSLENQADCSNEEGLRAWVALVCEKQEGALLQGQTEEQMDPPEVEVQLQHQKMLAFSTKQ